MFCILWRKGGRCQLEVKTTGGSAPATHAQLDHHRPVGRLWLISPVTGPQQTTPDGGKTAGHHLIQHRSYISSEHQTGSLLSIQQKCSRSFKPLISQLHSTQYQQSRLKVIGIKEYYILQKSIAFLLVQTYIFSKKMKVFSEKSKFSKFRIS